MMRQVEINIKSFKNGGDVSSNGKKTKKAKKA